VNLLAIQGLHSLLSVFGFLHDDEGKTRWASSHPDIADGSDLDELILEMSFVDTPVKTPNIDLAGHRIIAF